MSQRSNINTRTSCWTLDTNSTETLALTNSNPSLQLITPPGNSTNTIINPGPFTKPYQGASPSSSWHLASGHLPLGYPSHIKTRRKPEDLAQGAHNGCFNRSAGLASRQSPQLS